MNYSRSNHTGDAPKGNANLNLDDEIGEPLTNYEAESEFLEGLAAKLLRPFLSEIPKEEIAELKRILLPDLETLLDDLTGELNPRPKTYRTKGDYYVIEGFRTYSLFTGRIFDPEIKGRQEGEGDPFEIWALFKQTNFYGALQGLTVWAINLRNKREAMRQRVNCLPGNAVKQLLWQAFEEGGLVAGKKVLFSKGKRGKRATWTTARAVWKLLEQVYGELCREARDTDAFSSPHKVRELLDELAGSRDDRRFKTLRRERPKVTEYSFVPTDVPLDF
jgi:hypothetical protein